MASGRWCCTTSTIIRAAAMLGTGRGPARAADHAGPGALQRRLERWGWLAVAATRRARRWPAWPRRLASSRGARAAAYRAYRLSATPALARRGGAAASAGAARSARPMPCRAPASRRGHVPRKCGCAWPSRANGWPRLRSISDALNAAWAAIDASGLRRAADGCWATGAGPRRGARPQARLAQGRARCCATIRRFPPPSAPIRRSISMRSSIAGRAAPPAVARGVRPGAGRVRAGRLISRR